MSRSVVSLRSTESASRSLAAQDCASYGMCRMRVSSQVTGLIYFPDTLSSLDEMDFFATLLRARVEGIYETTLGELLAL